MHCFVGRGLLFFSGGCVFGLVDGFKGDVYLLVKLLLPGSGKKRVYNLQSKQIVKLMSQVHKGASSGKGVKVGG